MMKKLFLVLLIFISFTTISAQTQDEQPAVETETKQSFFDRLDFFFCLTPSIYLNTKSKASSAPSPVFYPLYIGLDYSINSFISVQPSLRIYMNYFLCDGTNALPAEIENRTALAYSFFLNLPANFNVLKLNKSKLNLSAGLGILIRFATLANNVNETDYGATGSAKDDVKFINEWFYQKARFLYLTGGIDYIYSITDTIKLGPEFFIAIPLGSLFSEFSLQEMLFSLGLKIMF
ncbi:MAG: hypothetical protein IKX23_00340 [Treponema sp.]|nr:hypothetical protein [Treponema sp.]